MSGWVAIDRGIFEHTFFAREPMSEREAWVWIITRAAWQDTRHRVGSAMVEVPRGSLMATLREMQQAWLWGSDKRVRLFLARLKNEEMIGLKTDASGTHKKTQISVCKYEFFQQAGRNGKTQTDASGTQAGRTKETREQNNKEQEKKEEAKASSDAADLDACFQHFNATAERVGWSRVQSKTNPRLAALSQRIKSVGGADKWREAINRAAMSPLLTGQSGSGWRADFDWLAKPANFTKLMEGNYDQRSGNGKPSTKGDDRLSAFIAGASAAPPVDSWPDSNPSQPLLARR
jgi:hypothetical protein